MLLDTEKMYNTTLDGIRLYSLTVDRYGINYTFIHRRARRKIHTTNSALIAEKELNYCDPIDLLRLEECGQLLAKI